MAVRACEHTNCPSMHSTAAGLPYKGFDADEQPTAVLEQGQAWGFGLNVEHATQHRLDQQLKGQLSFEIRAPMLTTCGC